jgi:rSAM-associated Gly-rich repeat protein
MSANKRISKVLALLIPTGVLGISSALAATQVRPQTTPLESGLTRTHVAERLADIRKAMSDVSLTDADQPNSEPRLMLADWLNAGGGGVGWRNGGWGNGGGWRNGGWGNGGWHNWGNGGWGNGGWHNWGNGGWHNFWHNW